MGRLIQADRRATLIEITTRYNRGMQQSICAVCISSLFVVLEMQQCQCQYCSYISTVCFKHTQTKMLLYCIFTHFSILFQIYIQQTFLK